MGATADIGQRQPVIVFVENSLRENGGLRVSLEHARRLRARGARTSVAVVQDVREDAVARPDPSLPLRMLTPSGSRLRSTAPLALVRLARLARGADVVVAGSEIGNCLLLGYAAARLAGRPFAVLVQADLDGAIRDWVPGALQSLTRWVHRRVDAAVCVAESVVPGVLANGLLADRAHVVVNGIDVATVRARAGLPPIGEDGTAATGGTPAGPPQDDYVPVVVANGRLSVAKNIPLLLRAHQRVRAMGLDHRLLIMGEGPERPAIEAEIAALGITDSVTLAGFVAEPYGAIATADLFVLSSDSEGLPLTLIEAMAVGAPIVSTRCGSGPGLLLDGGRYGELVPVGSTDALAMAIERHLRDPQTLRERAALGPVRAVRFDAGRAADGLLTVLSALAGGTTPVSAPTRG